MSRIADFSETVGFLVKSPSREGLFDVFRAVLGMRLSYNPPLDSEEIREQTLLIHEAIEKLCAETLNRGAWPPHEFTRFRGLGHEPKPSLPGKMIARIELAESGKTGYYQAYLNFWDGSPFLIQVWMSKSRKFESIQEAQARISSCPILPI